MRGPNTTHTRARNRLQRTSALMATGGHSPRPSLEDEDTDVLRGCVTEQVTQGRPEGIPGPCASPQTGWPPFVCLSGLPCSRVAGFKWAEDTPPQVAQGSGWSHGGSREGRRCRTASRSRWASLTRGRLLFPNQHHTCCCQEHLPRHLRTNISPGKGQPGESQVRGNPLEDFGLESEIMGLGSSCIL